MGIKTRLLILFLFATYSFFQYFKLQGNFQSLNTNYKFKIFKDQHGIPRIYGRDKNSINYALGFSQAQDRLWNLHIKKKIFHGRLSQIFGADTLQLDLQNRNYDFTRVGIMNAKLLSQQDRKSLQAYCDGINDYAKNVNFLPFEFYLFGTQWQNWTVQDSLSMLGFLSFLLQFDWMYELARQRLLQTVGFDLAWKLMPFGDDNLFRQITIINNKQLKEQGLYQQYDSSKIQSILKKHWVNKNMTLGSIKMPNSVDSIGSNAWVVGGNHTKNGRPILSNDPHLGLIIPSLFYMAQFVLLDQNNQPQLQAFGAKSDGVPYLSIGINGKFAWGSTASYVDNKDVYHETVRNNSGVFQYLFKQKWIPFQVRQQKITVRGKGQINQKFYHTHRGPVVQHLFPDLHFKYGFPIPMDYRINHTVTLRSAIYDPDSKSYNSLQNLAFCTNYQQFQRLSANILAPNIDSVYITDNGTWGYAGIGRTPVRKIPQMGGFMKDGSTDQYDFGQYLSWNQMPKLINPERGYIAMANNKFAEDSYASRTSIHEITTGRAYRIDKILKQKIQKGHKFTHDDMKKIQLDTKDQYLSQVFPGVLKQLQTVRQIWSNHKTQKLYQIMNKWNYDMPKQSVQASIYHVFQHHFHQSLLHGTDLSVQQRQAILNHAFFQIFLMRLYQKIGNKNLTNQQKTVCQNSNNNYTNIHPCLINAALTFKNLPQQLQKLFKSDKIQQYQWGKIHQHTFKAIPWSQIPGLKDIFGRQIPAGGNSRTINVAILSHQTKSYNSIAGPVFRFITDLNQTYFSLDNGQSDRISSPYYDNFLGKDMYIKYQKLNALKEQKTQWNVLIDRL